MNISKDRFASGYIILTLFFTGAGIMVLELLGTRIIGPYYGVDLYIWTSLIAVTLISLAIGYWFGGRLADKKPEIDLLYLLIFFAGIFIILIPSISPPVLKFSRIFGIQGGSLFSSCVLFVIPLVFLGMATPFSVKLLTRELKVLGATAGKLYAISTLGSVFGTILCGFVLIPNLGIRKIVYLTAIALILLWAGWKILSGKYGKSLLALPFFLVIAAASGSDKAVEPVRYKAQSLFGEIKVADIKEKRWLLIDGTSHTVIDKKSGDSLFEFSYYFEIMPLMAQKIPSKRLLLLGLGGGAVAKAFSEYGIKVDAVDIDGKVVEASKKYFNAGEYLEYIYIRDAREYLTALDAGFSPGAERKKYDFIVLDAFSAAGHPLQLFTLESFKEIKKALKEDGIFGVNSVGFYEGKNSRVWRSVYKTLKEAFPYVRVFPVRNGTEAGPTILIASGRDIFTPVDAKSARNKTAEKFIRKMLENEVPRPGPAQDAIVLTDDYNPLELWDSMTVAGTRNLLFEVFGDEILLN
ncbi:MAG: fused MFS/spermidine synthase [Elusimicrobia bacterium]|nr:fused MFS/spermidine synthase [Elusimicrobiota bacterium]